MLSTLSYNEFVPGASCHYESRSTRFSSNSSPSSSHAQHSSCSPQLSPSSSFDNFQSHPQLSYPMDLTAQKLSSYPPYSFSQKSQYAHSLRQRSFTVSQNSRSTPAQPTVIPNIAYPHHSKYSSSQSFHHSRSLSHSPDRSFVYPVHSHSPPSHHSSTNGLNAARNIDKEISTGFLSALSNATSNYKVIDLDVMSAKNGGTMSHAEFDDKMHALIAYRDDKFVDKNALDKAMIDLSDEYNRFLDRNVLDMHFLTREQSKAVLKKRLDEIKECKRPKIVYIVTGRGNHSIDNNPVIKKYVQEVAEKKKFKCEEMEGNGGVLVMNCRLIRN